MPSFSENNATELAPETLVLRVRPEDIYWAQCTKMRRPILLVLQRATDTLWRLYDEGLAIEVTPPYRACRLPHDALGSCELWQAAGEESLCWQVELWPTREREGYSLLQKRELVRVGEC